MTPAAMMAFQHQALEQLGACKAELAAAGRGFSSDDVAAIAASAAANPYPEGYGPGAESKPSDVAAAQEMAKKAMEADYPETGLAPDDPRFAPIDGVSLALCAIGSKAIGWSTDPAFRQRIARALGFELEAWDRACTALSARVQADVVLATFYGQLFSQA
jgi:nucleoside-diphosphate-sugar epimerase